MGIAESFSSQKSKTSTMTIKETTNKPLSIKLKILVDSWYPNSIDFKKNNNRVSSIFFLRKNQMPTQNTTNILTLCPQTSHKLKKNVTDAPLSMKNSLKITTDQNYSFIIQNLDSDMHVWKFAKQWCQLKENDRFFINGIQYILTKLIKDEIQQIKCLQKKCSSKKQQDKTSPCKICFQNTYDVKNMLMSPCKCTGSMANVHTKCLASWILQNNQSQKSVFSADLKKQKCQICNTNYLQSKAFQQILSTVIFQTQGLQAPYVIFEGISIKQNKSYKSVLVLSFKNKNQFKINHNGKPNIMNSEQNQPPSYQIKYQKGQIYIRDINSKFGTGIGILAQFPLIISKDKQQQSLMINHNMLITFSVLNKIGTTESSLSIDQTINNLIEK